MVWCGVVCVRECPCVRVCAIACVRMCNSTGQSGGGGGGGA